MLRSTGIRAQIGRIFATASFLCLAWTVQADCASGAEPDWRIGLASVKVTPQEPVRMSGYAGRTQPSQGVVSDLFAKSLAFEDKHGNQAVLVTSDVIGFAASFAEPTCQLISEKTGLERNQILLNSSHTHTGPAIRIDAKDLDFPADQAQATLKYSRWLQERLVEAVVASLKTLEPARLSWGTGVATFVMNRREFTDSDIRLGVNPRGLVDRSVPVLITCPVAMPPPCMVAWYTPSTTIWRET